MQIRRSINLHQSQVSLRIPAHDFAIVFFAVGELHFDLIGIFDHMVIGHDVPFAAKNKPGTNAALLGTRGWFPFGKRSKEIPERTILSKWVPREITRPKGNVLYFFDHLDIDHPGANRLRKLTKVCRHHGYISRLRWRSSSSIGSLYHFRYPIAGSH